MEDCSIEGEKKTVLEVWPESEPAQKKGFKMGHAFQNCFPQDGPLPVTYGVITPYKCPYNQVTAVKTPIRGVIITLVRTGRGPSCMVTHVKLDHFRK